MVGELRSFENEIERCFRLVGNVEFLLNPLSEKPRRPVITREAEVVRRFRLDGCDDGFAFFLRKEFFWLPLALVREAADPLGKKRSFQPKCLGTALSGECSDSFFGGSFVHQKDGLRSQRFSFLLCCPNDHCKVISLIVVEFLYAVSIAQKSHFIV